MISTPMPPMPRRAALSALAVLLLCALSALAPAVARAQTVTIDTVTIDFDTGVHGTAVGAAYAAQGITFSNAQYFNTSGSLAGQSGNNVIFSLSGGFNGRFFGQADAVVAVFDRPVDSVTIRACDVGSAGARIDAYDATVDGTLIGHDEFIGEGDGVGAFHDLSVSVAGIRRIVMYQPAPNTQDALGLDNLRFHFAPPDTTAPTVTASANKSIIPPNNGKLVPVVVTGTITDNAGGSGINAASLGYAVVDEYGQVQPSGNITLGAGGAYTVTVYLQASRLDTDKNGRTYTITVSASDNAGNPASKAVVVTVPHDQAKK